MHQKKEEMCQSKLFCVRIIDKSVASFWEFALMEGEGSGTPLQYSCLENSMDGGTWWAAVHGVAKSQT